MDRSLEHAVLPQIACAAAIRTAGENVLYSVNAPAPPAPARVSGREQVDDSGAEADQCAGAEGPQDRPFGAEEEEGREGSDRE